MDSRSISLFVNSQTNVQIDTTKNTKKSNDFGIAFFNLRISEGKNGIYKISFSADGVSSKMSSEFKLFNYITSVEIYQSLPQTIEV